MRPSAERHTALHVVDMQTPCTPAPADVQNARLARFPSTTLRSASGICPALSRREQTRVKPPRIARRVYAPEARGGEEHVKSHVKAGVARAGR
jgi:hypothetical protein